MTIAQEKNKDILYKRIEILRDSVSLLDSKIIDAGYFNIQNNDKAIENFSYKTVDADMERIEQEILALNHGSDGNPLVGYGKINDSKCIINKIQIINHKWIIADFYAGDLRGEILVKYQYNADKPTEFHTLETVLYPNK